MKVEMVKSKLKGIDFLDLSLLTKDELEDFIRFALKLKREGTKGIRPLAGKAIGLLFEKPSTRTRVSFEVAVLRLGGHPIYLSGSELQLKRGETIEDTGRVLSHYLDGIILRTFSHERLVKLAQVSNVPVINALTDESHPCQALADMLTILEYRDALEGLKLAYLGDGNNVAHSLMRAGTKLAMDVWIATPAGREPRKDIVEECNEYSEIYGGSLTVTNDPERAASGADVLYTDVWVSMGKEGESEEAASLFKGFQINEEKVSMAAEDVMVMHCLPANRGEEITDDVLDGSHSAVWDQAENRLHAQIALLDMIYG